MKNILIMLILLSSLLICAQTKYPDVNREIEAGNFKKASSMIDSILEKDSIDPTGKYELNFQKDRLNRIRLDFQKTSRNMLEYIRKYYPNANEETLKKWENDGSLEYKIIDGKKFYFNRAAANLFRVNKEAKEQKEKIDGPSVSKLTRYLSVYIPDVFKESKELKKNLVKKVTHKLDYTVTVEPNAVPDGEVIRCWLPYPKEDPPRQNKV